MRLASSFLRSPIIKLLSIGFFFFNMYLVKGIFQLLTEREFNLPMTMMEVELMLKALMR